MTFSFELVLCPCAFQKLDYMSQVRVLNILALINSVHDTGAPMQASLHTSEVTLPKHFRENLAKIWQAQVHLQCAHTFQHIIQVRYLITLDVVFILSAGCIVCPPRHRKPTDQCLPAGLGPPTKQQTRRYYDWVCLVWELVRGNVWVYCTSL